MERAVARGTKGLQVTPWTCQERQEDHVQDFHALGCALASADGTAVNPLQQTAFCKYVMASARHVPTSA
eukprot:2609349-Amphidinium_carterae.2